MVSEAHPTPSLTPALPGSSSPSDAPPSRVARASIQAPQSGFSLIELMVVVAIVGLLASIAVPAFMKYIKRSRTAEAGQMLSKIYVGARTYYLDPTQPGLTPVDPQFPAALTGTTPALGDCCLTGGKCAAEQTQWDTEMWTALQFSVPDPHYFSYSYDTPDEFAEFTARANGDLDCDGVYSTFEMFGRVDPALAEGSTGSGAVKRTRELE